MTFVGIPLNGLPLRFRKLTWRKELELAETGTFGEAGIGST
jgi:hypothetical protein